MQKSLFSEQNPRRISIEVSLGGKELRPTGSTRDGGHVPASFHHHPNNVTRLAHLPLTLPRCYVLVTTQEEDLGDLLKKSTTNQSPLNFRLTNLGSPTAPQETRYTDVSRSWR
jgi:hypothetical protein